MTDETVAVTGDTDIGASKKVCLGCRDIATAKEWASSKEYNFVSGVKSGQIALVEDGASVVVGEQQQFSANGSEFAFVKSKIITGDMGSNSSAPSKVWWFPEVLAKKKN